MIGHQFNYTFKVLDARRSLVDMGDKNSDKLKLYKEFNLVLIQIVASIALLAIGFILLFIFDNFDSIAFGLIGLVIGYWLR